MHRIDPRTGAERLLVQFPARAVVQGVEYAGKLAVVRWGEPVEAGSRLYVDVIDLETGRRFPTPTEDAPRVALSADGALLVWSSASDGHGFVYDTASGTVRTTIPPLLGDSDPVGGVKISPSGRYLFTRGVLFDRQSGRELQRPKVSGSHRVDGASFVMLGGKEKLVVAGDKRMLLVDPEAGTSREADVDCLDGASSGYREAVAPTQLLFVRQCPRGVLYADLRKLDAHLGAKPLTPVRVRDVYTYRLDSERLLFALRKRQSLARDPYDIEDMATPWQVHDPATGSNARLEHPEPTVLQRAGDRALLANPVDQRCSVSGIPDLTPSDALCNASLSADGQYVAMAGNGTMTIAELTTLKTVYAAGDSMSRGDDGTSVSVSLEDDLLHVKVVSYGGGFSENEYALPRSSKHDAAGFESAEDDLHERPADDPRTKALLDQIPPELRGSCRRVGTLEQGKLSLLRCTSFDTEASLRYDTQSLAPVQAARSGSANPGYGPVGTVDGVVIENVGRAGTLQLLQMRDEKTQEIFARLYLGWDFAIATDGPERVQLFGNRKRAATWLRCFDAASSALLPFPTCAARAEGSVY